MHDEKKAGTMSDYRSGLGAFIEKSKQARDHLWWDDELALWYGHGRMLTLDSDQVCEYAKLYDQHLQEERAKREERAQAKAASAANEALQGDLFGGDDG